MTMGHVPYTGDNSNPICVVYANISYTAKERVKVNKSKSNFCFSRSKGSQGKGVFLNLEPRKEHQFETVGLWGVGSFPTVGQAGLWEEEVWKFM